MRRSHAIPAITAVRRPRHHSARAVRGRRADLARRRVDARRGHHHRRGGRLRAPSHCRFVLPLIYFTPDSLTYSAPLFLKRQYDRTLGQLPGRLPERRRRRRLDVRRGGGAVDNGLDGRLPGGARRLPPGTRAGAVPPVAIATAVRW